MKMNENKSNRVIDEIFACTSFSNKRIEASVAPLFLRRPIVLPQALVSAMCLCPSCFLLSVLLAKFPSRTSKS